MRTAEENLKMVDPELDSVGQKFRASRNEEGKGKSRLNYIE